MFVTRVINYIENRSVLSGIIKYQELQDRCVSTGEQLTVLMLHNGVKTISGEHFIKCTTVFATNAEVKFLYGVMLASEPELVKAVNNKSNNSKLYRCESAFVNNLCDAFNTDELDIVTPSDNNAVIVISNGKVSDDTLKLICK
ncbi:MAG: hypothetical protein HUJ63_12690 [Enterococcus sp.]|nr:hypothetical protein [Enterococcus sp.]